MKPYSPRRAGKRWLENAPPAVLDILDNGGKTADRYTVLFGFPMAYTYNRHGFSADKGAYGDTYIPYLGMSADPFSPQGVGLSGELRAHEAADYRYRCGKQRIRWDDLPPKVQECVRNHVAGCK